LERGKLGVKPEGVSLCFCTDPFLKVNVDATELLIELLHCDWEIPVATSSKCGTSLFPARHGMTIVSLDLKFWKTWEPNALNPYERIDKLQERGYVWISMEPYPPSAIWKQDLTKLLEELTSDLLVDFIVFGKWNYDKRARTEEARLEYAENIPVLRDFCKSMDVRFHVKSDTMKFAFGEDVDCL